MPHLQRERNIEAQLVVGGREVQCLGQRALRLGQLVGIVLSAAAADAQGEEASTWVAHQPPQSSSGSMLIIPLPKLVHAPCQVQHDHGGAVVVELAQRVAVHLDGRNVLLLRHANRGRDGIQRVRDVQ